MCLTCGCMEPNNDHGDPRHLLAKHVEQSATVDGIDVKKARKRIHKTLKVHLKAKELAGD